MTAPTVTRPVRYEVHTRTVTGTKDQLAAWLARHKEAGDLPEQPWPPLRLLPSAPGSDVPRWQMRVLVREREQPPHPGVTVRTAPSVHPSPRPAPRGLDRRIAWLVGGVFAIALAAFVTGLATAGADWLGTVLKWLVTAAGCLFVGVGLARMVARR